MGALGEIETKKTMFNYIIFILSVVRKVFECVDLIKFSVPTNPWWVIGITRGRDWFNSLKRNWNF